MAFIFVLILISSLSFSHNMWIERQGNFYVLHYGHRHSTHGGKKEIRYDSNNVLEVQCFDENLKAQKVDILKEYPLKIFGNCSNLYILFSSGYWTKTPYGTENLPKNKVKMAVDSWLSYESIKYIENFPKLNPISNKLEILPLNDVFSLKEGEKMRFKVFFNKKPISNVPVAYNGKPMGLTDEEGKINIKLRERGFQYIEVSYKEEVKKEEMNKIIYTSILNFEVK